MTKSTKVKCQDCDATVELNKTRGFARVGAASTSLLTASGDATLAFWECPRCFRDESTRLADAA